MSCAPYIICNITTSVSNLDELSWLSTFSSSSLKKRFLSWLTPHLVQFIKVTWCTVVQARTQAFSPGNHRLGLPSTAQTGTARCVDNEKGCSAGQSCVPAENHRLLRFFLKRMSATHTHTRTHTDLTTTTCMHAHTFQVHSRCDWWKLDSHT